MRIQSSSAVTAVAVRETATTQINQGSTDTTVSGPEQGALDCPAVATNWILSGGVWHDGGVWSDSATWED